VSKSGTAIRASSLERRSTLDLRVLVLASITDPAVELAVDVIDALGLPGIFILMVAESACIPIPSETTFLFAGFNVARGEYSLLAVVATGTFANVVGSWLAYAVGYYGRVDILEKHGRKLHVKPSHLKWADDWFAKYGSATVFFTRMLPFVRTFISLPAGVARMPFWRFTVLTTLGCIPWIFMLTFIGMQVGERWESWKDSLHYVDYAVLAMILLGIAYLLVRRRRRRSGAAAG
jgi:membrane protein DedA with SNARE-associated domain